MKVGFARVFVGVGIASILVATGTAAGQGGAVPPPFLQPPAQGTGPQALSQALGTRAQGSDRVAVATVFSVMGRFGVNEFGDRLIMSDVLLRVDEELKGPYEPWLQLTVEGGTVGDLRLEVSDLPSFERGERAVFFLDQTSPNSYQLHRRDLGVLKLSTDGARIQGAPLTLDDVRRAVRSVQ